MAISFNEQSSVSISTTEYSLVNNSATLTPQTNKCVMSAFVDTRNMVAGDQYEVIVYEKVVSGGTQIKLFHAVLDGAQPDGFFTPALPVGNGWDVTMKRLAGSNRTFNWSIRTVA